MSSDETIQSFALEMKISIDCLIKQFLDVGIIKDKFGLVTQTEREILLKHMYYNNTSIHKFSLRRQTRSTLNILSIGGQNKQVQVEVRKQQVYILPSTEHEYDDAHENDMKSKTCVNTFNLSHKSIDTITDSEFKISDINHINNDISFTNTLEKDIHKSNIIECDRKLNIKTRCKMNDKSQKIVSNKKQQFSKTKNVYSNWNSKLTSNYTNKISRNHSNKLDNFSVLEINKNDENQADHEKRYNSRIRFRNRMVGKLFKQKKNTGHCLYETDSDEFEKENKLYTSYRINKNKCKPSTLIQGFNKPTQSVSRSIVIGETISVLELSNKMSVKSSYMMKLMMKLGVMATINQIIDQETAQLVIEEMGHNAVLHKENELEELIMNDNSLNEDTDSSVNIKNNSQVLYKNRDPIVTMMGHVDHGKTSLLDYIRSTNIVSSESGGITQNIAAYRVTTKNGRIITFLDTPGHAAFTNMRIRGAQLTDIVILVIAADDGLMPQTIESIQHIKSIGVPMVVAINKIDKTDINVDLIKHDLNRYGFVPEEWGGKTQFVNVSAVSGIGVNALLDAVLLQSEILELKTTYHGMAKAIVIESSLDKCRGPVIIVLIKEGKLKCGDIILCGTEYGRVRAIRDEYGYDINIAWPSMPVEILGLSGIPNAGDMMIVVRDEKKAREVALYRQDKSRKIKLFRKQEESSVENVFNNINNNIKIIDLNFIIKSDTKGSLEAICEAIKKLSTNKIIIKILFASIGNISETDSVLASTSNAIILGFNVKSDPAARKIIESNHLDVRYYSIIYDLLNETQSMIENSTLISDSFEPNVIGSAEVYNIFHSTTHGTIAGCVVIDGIIQVRKKIIVFRNKVVAYKGELESLRRFKNDVNEVKSGMECGIGIKNYHDIRCGDVIKVLDVIERSV